MGNVAPVADLMVGSPCEGDAPREPLIAMLFYVPAYVAGERTEWSSLF